MSYKSNYQQQKNVDQEIPRLSSQEIYVPQSLTSNYTVQTFQNQQIPKTRKSEVILESIQSNSSQIIYENKINDKFQPSSYLDNIDSKTYQQRPSTDLQQQPKITKNFQYRGSVGLTQAQQEQLSFITQQNKYSQQQIPQYNPSYIQKETVISQISSNKQSVLSQDDSKISQDIETLYFMSSIENERLLKANSRLQTELQLIQSQVKQSDLYIKSKTNDSSDQMVRLNDEIQRLRTQLFQTQEQCDLWKSKYSSVDLSVQSKHEGTLKKLFEMENELNEWKNKYTLLERMKDQELDQFKTQQETRRKSLLNRELREVTLKFQADKTALVAENGRLKEVIDLRSQEIDEININYQELEDQYQILKKHQQRAFELEEKNKSLIKEIELVTYNLNIKSSQLESLEKQNRDFDLQFSNKQGELQSIIQFKEKQITDLNLQLVHLKEQLQEFSLFEKKFIDSEKSRNFSQGEINRLNSIINERVSSHENQNQQITTLQCDIVFLEQQNKQLQEKISKYESQYESMNLIIIENRSELKIYAEKLIQYESSIKEYNFKNQELQNTLNWTTQDLNAQKQKLQESGQNLMQLRQMESELNEYQVKLTLMSQEIERFNQSLQKKTQECEQYQIKNGELIRELNFLQTIQEQSKQQEQMIQQFNKETERLQRIYVDKQREYDQIIVERNELKQFQTRCYDYENLIVNLRREIDELKNYCNQYQKLEVTFQEQENTIVLLSQEIDRYKTMMSQSQGQIDQWKIRCSEFEQQVFELREENNNIQYLSEEIERLNRLLNDREFELNNYKQKYIDFNGLNQRIKEDMCLFVILFSEIESLRGRIMDKESEIDQIRKSQISYLTSKRF